MKIDLNELFKEKKENLLMNLEEEYFDDEDIYAYDVDEEDVLDLCKDEFSYQIKERGKEYYEEGKIESLHKCGNKYIAKVDGSHYETYDVNVEINFDVVDYSCSCPYEFPCKHEYAVLIAISKKEYIKVELKEEIKETEEPLLTLLEKIPAEEIKNCLLSSNGKENTIFNIPNFHNHFRNYLPTQSYDYYYNKLYNALLLEEDYEFITER